jgi:YD repeat-containing protein
MSAEDEDKNGATATATRPNSLVITNNYDKANRISSVVHSPTASSGDDITVSYTYDANGDVTQITDGLSNNWTKAYDALLTANGSRSAARSECPPPSLPLDDDRVRGGDEREVALVLDPDVDVVDAGRSID